jgi:hypothetical protein
MDDRFLSSARRPPRPEYMASLKRSLAAIDEDRRARVAARTRFFRGALFTLAPAAAAVIALVAFPEVRAAAQSFLELFRVKNFVAVQVDPERIKKLRDGAVDPLTLIGSQVTTRPAEPAQRFALPAAAFAAAGYAPHEPTFLPNGFAADSAAMLGALEAEVTIEARRLNEYLGSLGITDVDVPAALDGARIGVKRPRAVAIRYARGEGEKRRTASLVQSPHPEVSLPAGLPRERLAEIALRVLGLPSDEARRFAARIDWSSTLLIPIPSGKATFREIEVRGRRALMVESAGPESQSARLLLWSDDERVYALGGEFEGMTIVQIAESIP